jgi:hypothetical protein
MNKKQNSVHPVRLKVKREILLNLTSDMLKQIAGGRKPTTQNDTECYTGCDTAC